MPVRGSNIVETKTDEDEDGDDLQQHHHIVHFRRFANAAHENHREQHDNNERGPVEAEMPAGLIEDIALEVGES